MATVTPRAAIGRLAGPHVRLFQREAPLGYLLLAPALLVLLVFVAYPFLFGIWLSLTNSQIGQNGHFIGLGNFQFERSDTVFIQSFINTVSYTALTTVFKLGLGLIMALLLNQVFPAQRFVRAALLLPWIIPSVLSTLAWRWMFDPTFSVVNWVLINAHVAAGGVNWLGQTATALTSLMIVNIWRGTPFYGIAFLAGLQSVPTDLYEAARVDGASRWQQFRAITVPNLRPVLVVVLLLSTILTFGDFTLPYVLTNCAPYNSTCVLSTWAFQIGVNGGYIGIGAAISLVLFPLLTAIVAGVMVVLRRPE
ncbi:MAG: sugar ABC transporter permease [Candidatus Dormibacteraeota bacterium]|nr:sugar ABC transporter permease [Candidatus Dormibacteraeota bacterium]